MLMRMLCRSAVVKTELNVKARLPIYTVTLTYAHEVWRVTKRMTLWIQVAEISFLPGRSRLSLRHKVTISVIKE